MLLSIEKIITVENVDPKVRVKRNGLKKKLATFDFLFALMFMRIIMMKTKILTKQLQEKGLNIVDALTIIDATVENGLNAEIECMGAFGSKVEMDALAEYTRHYRTGRPPTRIDDNPDQTAKISFQEFYRKEMCLVLDSLIVEYADNIKVCVDQIRPLGESLQLPLTKPKHA